MEWGHRILGRLIGVLFVGPLAYFAVKKKIDAPMVTKLSALSILIGFQGLLGWYMVKSGLEDSVMDTPGAVPRVSQYRLAAHLGTAFLLYVGMFGTGLAVIKDWKFAHGAPWSGLEGRSISSVMTNPLVKTFKKQAWAITALVFLTALSGVFVFDCLGFTTIFEIVKVPSLLGWMPDYYTMNSPSWAVVWYHPATNSLTLPIPKILTSLTNGGGISLKIQQQYNLIIVF